MKTFATLAAAALAFGLVGGAAAQTKGSAIKRTDRPTTTISNLVTVPDGYALTWISGTTAGSGGTPVPEGADTKAQGVLIYQKFKDWLAAEGMTLGDIVAMRVYLVADPATGRMDVAGANAAYNQFFGTADQPGKPARVTVQVAALGGRTTLIEIEAQAAKRR